MNWVVIFNFSILAVFLGCLFAWCLSLSKKYNEQEENIRKMAFLTHMHTEMLEMLSLRLDKLYKNSQPPQ